ncbi:hypothetical protein OK016_25250 [Vibrio chagasii]|nr:hypothetical protein [Vibrio chagasii]
MSCLTATGKPGWRSPGEGIPPSWDWSGSTNIESVDWHWPIPGYYEQLDVMMLGVTKARQLSCHVNPERQIIKLKYSGRRLPFRRVPISVC